MIKNLSFGTFCVFCLFSLSGCAGLNKTPAAADNYGRNLIPFVEFNPENKQIWGFLDEDTGEIVIKAKYEYVMPFVGNYALVRTDRHNKQLIIDKNEKKIRELTSNNITDVYFLVSESGNNTLLLMCRNLNRTRFQIGWAFLGVTTSTGFYKDDYYKYKLVNLVTGKTIIPEKENYLDSRLQTAGKYLIADKDLYEFLDNGDVKLVSKNNPQLAERLLNSYFNERGINAKVTADHLRIKIDYTPYIKAKFENPNLDGAFDNFNPLFTIPFARTEPFFRDHRDLLNAPFELNERKFWVHFRDRESGKYAVGIYNETKKEWELHPYTSITFTNTNTTEFFYRTDIQPTNNPNYYHLQFKSDNIGWDNNRKAQIAGGIYCVSEYDFKNDLYLFENYPPRTLTLVAGGSSSQRRYFFPRDGVYYRDYSRIKNPSFTHSERITAVVFSPDGKSLITCSTDSRVKLWDIESGELIKTYLPQGGVRSAAFSPDGKIITVGLGSGRIIIFDTESGDILHTIRDHHSSYVYALAFSPDGKTFLSGSYDQTVKLWDAQSAELIRTFTGFTMPVYSIPFSPDGKTFLTASGSDPIKLFDTESGREIRTFRESSYVWVTSVDFSPDGKTFISASNRTVCVWNAANGQKIRSLNGHSDSLYVVSFSPDGKTILSGGADKKIIIWDAATGNRIRTISDNLGEIRTAAFSTDGKYIACGGFSKQVKLFDAESGEFIRTFLEN